jgi:ribonuclease R
VHEAPSYEKLLSFQQFIAHYNHSLQLSGETVRPQELQRLLAEVVGTPEEKVVNQVLLRSMKQASYATHNHGHFGLAADNYCHFTSPIRRYPDLVIHRALRACLHNRPLPDSVVPEELAADVSAKERRAMNAERDLVALKKCQFMAPRIGESFPATVASVQPFGLFIELEGMFIEGLLHISALQDDYYHFEEDLQRLVGYNQRRVFQVGVPIKVRLVRVNLDSREIDFVPDVPAPRPQLSRRGRGKR